MALSIGVSPGSTILVDKTKVTVLEVSHRTISLQVGHGLPVVVTDEERTEIMPSVFVFVGVSEERASGGRLAFEAPRYIKISRQGRQPHA